MLDYLNWYLIELDRNLRGRRSAQANAEFLLESRNHLEERVDELVSKGIDRQAAVKAAILDFGDPKSVAQAFRGVRPLSKLTYRVAVGIAVVLALCVVPSYCIAMVDAPDLHRSGFVSGLLVAAAFSFVVMAWLIWRTRKWVALPVCGLALAGSFVGSLVFTSQTGLANLQGEVLHVFLPQRQQLIDTRVDWLKRFDVDFAKLQAFRATDRKGPEAQAILADLAGPGWNAPVPVHWSGQVPRVLPSDKEGILSVWTRNDYGKKYRIESWFGSEGAMDVWRQNADEYAAFLKKHQRRVEQELTAFVSLQPSSFGERWFRHGWIPVGLIGLGSLMALLLNGLVLIFSEVLSSVRRYRWRRQLS